MATYRERLIGWDALLEGSRIYLPIGKWECTLRLDNKSWMNREVHVRFREGVGVKLPRATRRCKKNYLKVVRQLKCWSGQILK